MKDCFSTCDWQSHFWGQKWSSSVSRSFIPDKNMVFCPEQLLRVILAHIHYMPDHWQGNAHRYETRDQFSQLFQYKAVSVN